MKKLLPNSIFTLSLFVLILVCYFSNKNINANVLDLKQKIYLHFAVKIIKNFSSVQI